MIYIFKYAETIKNTKYANKYLIYINTNKLNSC